MAFEIMIKVNLFLLLLSFDNIPVSFESTLIALNLRDQLDGA